MPPSPSSLAVGDDGPTTGLRTTSSDEIHSCSDDSAANAKETAGILSLQSLPSVPSLQRLCPSPPTSSSPSAASWRLISTLRPSSAPIYALAVSASTGLLYAASGEQVRSWDFSSLSEVAAFNLSGDGAVKSLAFAGDGSVLTAHQDRRIRVWRPESAEPAGDVRSFRHLLVATLPTVYDRLVRGFWPKNYVRVRRHRRRLWVEHADAVSGISAGGDGLVYSVSWDRTLKVWRAKDLRCVESVAAHDDAVNAVAVAGDGTVFTGSADGRIRVWRKDGLSKKHNLVTTLERHRLAVNALALGSGGGVLYSGAGDRSILVWEREETANYMAVAGALRGHRGAVLCLAGAGEEAAVVVSGSEDRTVRVWRRGEEAADGGRRYDCLAVLEGHGRAVRAVVVAAPAKTMATLFTVCSGSLDGEIKIWKIGITSLSSTKDDTNQSFNGIDYKLIR